MNRPKLTTPSGLFDYLIIVIVGLAALFGLYIAAVDFGVIRPWL